MRLSDIPLVIDALEMMVFTILTLFDVAYYGVRTYSGVPSPCLHSFPDDMPGSELAHLFSLPPSLLGSMRQFGTEDAVRRI